MTVKRVTQPPPQDETLSPSPNPESPPQPETLQVGLSRGQGLAIFALPQLLDLINLEQKGIDLTILTTAGAIEVITGMMDVARDRCTQWGDDSNMPPFDAMREKDAIAAGAVFVEHLQAIDSENANPEDYSNEIEENGIYHLKVHTSKGVLILREPTGLDTRKASKSAKKGLIYSNCTKIVALCVKWRDRNTINMAELQKLSWGDYFKIQYALAGFPSN